MNIEFYRQAIFDGVFFEKKLNSWRGTHLHSIRESDFLDEKAISSILPHHSSLRYYKRINSPHNRRLKIFNKNLSYVINFYSHRTSYGFFLPRKNFVIFKKETDQLRNEFFNIRDSVLENWDEMLLMMKKQCVETAGYIWNVKYGNEGDPTENFIEDIWKKNKKDIGEKDEIAEKFTFNIYYHSPYMNADKDLSPLMDANSVNDALCKDLHDSIGRKRKRIYIALWNKRDRVARSRNLDKSARNISSLCKGFSEGVFYDDPEFINKMAELRNFIMYTGPSEQRLDTIIDHISGILDYLKENREYPIGRIDV
jgi:hypothetical protein